MATTVEKIYKLDIQGTDSVNDLKNAIEQLNDKLKTLNETSIEYKNTLAQLTEYQSKLADAMKGISDSSQTTNESLNGIKETVDGVAESISALGEDVMDAFAEGLAQGMAEAAQETLQLGETMDKGVTSVKDLKQEISDLRDRLVTLDKGSDDYKATVQELVDAQVKLKEVMNAGKNETQAAEGSYNALSQRMSALKQVWKETTDEATRNEIGKQINEINNQLKALDASIGNSQRNVGNYKSALEGLDESFVGWKQELKECKEALQQLDPSTQAYAETMARAAELTHQLSDQQEMIKYASTDVGDQLENVRGIATNMAAGFSAVNAAMGLFGEENEEIQQAMLKVQQAMALVQGMQGLDGFMKRTKGLSQSLGLATKATKAQTAATKADALASKQDATAKGAEATATAGVIPAQLGLNAAMKANPIGFIIGLIASLIAIFSLLKDKIMEMIGSNKEMSAAFDKVKAVLAGFGNIIKKSVINPIKMAIIPIKTLAKVMIDLFKGDWAKIGDDIKDGFNEMKDTAIDTINVVGAFKEGYDKKTAEQAEAARKAEAAAREKELDNIIKDNEAKYGSDWKYTEEAQKLYEEMFKVRMAQYKEDSDEYREAQRDKMAYDRELQEKQDEAAKKSAADAKKAAEDAAKARKKILEDNLKSIEKAYTDFYGKFKNYISKENQNLMGITDQWDDWASKLVISFKSGSTVIERNVSDMKKYLMENFGVSKKEADAFVKQIVEMYYAGTSKIKTLINGKPVSFEISDQFIKGLQEQYGFTLKEAQDIVDEIRANLTKADLDNIVATSLANMQKDFYNLDRVVKETMGNVSAAFDLKEALSGITIPDEAVANIENLFSMASQAARKELIDIEDEIDRLYGILAKDKTGPYYGMTMEELGQTLPTFQKFLDKKNELEAKLNQLELERFRKVSDVYKQDWENRLTIVKEGNQAINDIAEQNFKEQINNAIRWQGVYGNALRDLYEDKDYYTETYNEQKGQLERLLEMYNEMANDEKLTFEEKENAKREAAKITGELIQLEYDKEVNMLKVQKGLWKEWVNAVKDAASGVGDILGSLSDYYTGLMELEQAKIDKQLEDKEITEEQAKALYAQQRENFDKAKNLQLAMTWINGFSAAIGAYQSMASIPYVGPVLGAVAAAAALATTAVQAAKIKQTTMDNPYGGGGGGSSSSVNYQLPDVMEYENSLGRNLTGMDDTDNINNDGSGRGEGKGETRVYVVESDIQNALNKSNKRKTEVTF